MKQPIIWTIVALLVVLVGGWYFLQAGGASAPTLEETPEEENEFIDASKDGAAAPVSAVTVRYTDQGFSPAILEVPVGTTVTFINQGTGEMWVAVDEHPTHTNYDGTTRQEHCPNNGTVFDQCERSATYSFTFTKAGTFDYHNHTQASHTGTIVVR